MKQDLSQVVIHNIKYEKAMTDGVFSSLSVNIQIIRGHIHLFLVVVVQLDCQYTVINNLRKYFILYEKVHVAIRAHIRDWLHFVINAFLIVWNLDFIYSSLYWPIISNS